MAKRMLTALSLPDAELSLVLCDDATIHELNRDFRHKDKPTDVLAFAMREGKFGDTASPLLGDIVISLQTTKRQAREHKRSFEEEVRMLLAHGLLHLLGFDHQTVQQDRRMKARTDLLCATASLSARQR